MEKTNMITFEEYLDLILGDKGFDYNDLSRITPELLTDFKSRLDNILSNLRTFGIHSTFSKDDETFLLKWIQKSR